MDEILKILKQNDIEITDEIRKNLSNAVEKSDNPGNSLTQKEVNEMVRERLDRKWEAYETEIDELKAEMEELVDSKKAGEYLSRIEELENNKSDMRNGLIKDYELKMAALEAGVEDIEYFEYLVEKNKVKKKLQLDDDFLSDGTFINAKLLHVGYANLLTIPPNVKYVNSFKKLVKEARENERGLWAKQEEEKTVLPVISWEEAGDYIGEKVIIEGTIVDTYDSGEAIFLNFDEDYSETFTAVIFSSDEYKFNFESEDYYLSQKVKVRGKFKEYEGAPEIIVEEPRQLEE